ncbi:MAG TPA: hypothetical protein VF720_04555 [Candidatus Eisenbacteria bacterium]
MNRRQMIALFAFPTLVTSLGIASVQLTGAAPQANAAGGSCCDPTCCLTSAGTVMVAAQLAPTADPAIACAIPTAAPAATSAGGCCDAGSCCAVSCEAPAESPAR